MYQNLERKLFERVAEFVLRKYGLGIERFAVEQPPNVTFGDYAFPLAFALAKKLRRPPRRIADEIVGEIGPVEGFEKLGAAGAGYINAFVDRGAFAAAVLSGVLPKWLKEPSKEEGKILVEHSSINPNKAAHIGHLRNAILGDTFVRLLRSADRKVDIQNYIDNTGVQVADVIVGFLHLEKKSRAEIEALTHQPRFDYYCWDVYARASQWYELDPENKTIRLQTLHEIEQGGNQTAEIADLISTAVLRRHLETMDRLDIEYDFLPRESEILHLHFWDAAFQKLKDAGVLFFETQGKNQGCWVMRRAGTGKASTAEYAGNAETNSNVTSASKNSKINDEAERVSEEDQKVIVRSNGTVGYVGKDIAYHMWKFGLLGKDFGYRKFFQYPNGHECWISAEQGEKDHPHFGSVAEIYNVIDSRQAEAQNSVIEALRELGHEEAAQHYTHFSYAMVALTPRCAAELGYELSDEEKGKACIEVSGRKGFGVKADDLIDRLISSAKHEVDSRNPERPEAERQKIAEQIAIGALRYFMLKFTKNSVIAFDFKDALSFEGETGPYAQYAVVRATNIFRKGGLDADTFSRDIAGGLSRDELSRFLVSGDSGANSSPTTEDQRPTTGNPDELWELWLTASKTAYVIDQCIATTEPAYLAKHVFQLAQLFNAFYHRYPILTETDEARKRFLLATAAVVRRELIAALRVMGIEAPAVM